jgi:hypothetical protein
VSKVDINRFDVAGPKWNGVKISDGQVGERIAFQAKIELQILFGREVKRDSMANAQDERSMNN